MRILELNVRVPEQNCGDLNAQFACLKVGERKVHDIIERFGVDAFKAGLDQLLDYAEEQARALVAHDPGRRLRIRRLCRRGRAQRLSRAAST